MLRRGLPADQWKKSSYSEAGATSCVETQTTADGLVALGDSKDRARGAYIFAPEAWQAFVDAVRTGRISA